MPNSAQFTHNDYEILEREVLYQGIFRLVRYHIRQRLFDGGWSETYKREILERYPAAGILPYDPILNRVILIEQFRAGSLSDPKSPWLIEVPAGVLAQHENPEELARREAKEEANCDIDNVQFICDYFVSPGGSNEFISLFCGKVDASHVSGVHGLKDEHEDIRVMNLSVEDALVKLRTGQIKTAPAIISLLWLELNRWRLQEIWL